MRNGRFESSVISTFTSPDAADTTIFYTWLRFFGFSASYPRRARRRAARRSASPRAPAPHSRTRSGKPPAWARTSAARCRCTRRSAVWHRSAWSTPTPTLRVRSAVASSPRTGRRQCRRSCSATRPRRSDFELELHAGAATATRSRTATSESPRRSVMPRESGGQPASSPHPVRVVTTGGAERGHGRRRCASAWSPRRSPRCRPRCRVHRMRNARRRPAGLGGLTQSEGST